MRNAEHSALPAAARRAKGSGASAPVRRSLALASVFGLLSIASLALGASSAFAHPAHVFKSSFGAVGPGAGELALRAFERPTAGSGIAVNLESGDIYVADTGNHRIDTFDSEGNFIRAWGFGVADGTTGALQSCTVTCHAGIAGAQPGQLSEPTFIAVDNSPGGEGDVYVGDSGDGIVTKFDAGGHLLTGWGEGGQISGSPVLATGTGDLTEGSTTIANLSIATGAFEAGQALSGSGITGGATIQEVGPTFLRLNEAVTTGGSGVSLSARFPFTGGDEFRRGLDGIAIDPSGNLWVGAGRECCRAGLVEFGRSGDYIASRAPSNGWPSGIAIDAAGNFFLATGSDVVKLDASGSLIGKVDRGLSQNINTVGLAVDPAGGDLFLDNTDQGAGEPSSGTHVSHFPPSCEPAAGLCVSPDEFGSSEEPEAGRLQGGQGLAVGPGHIVYVADAATNHIVVYRPTIQPDVTTGPVINLAQTTATLQGEVNPDGVELSECFFEYGETTAYGQKAPCAETPAQIGTGHEAEPVHADISGLGPTAYHYRLVARNQNNPQRGADRGFGASIDSTSVGSAAFTEATLTAQINPGGLDTTCQLQYVEETTFNVSAFAEATTVPCEPADLGEGSAEVEATATLAGLTPGTSYRFRFLANSAAHAVEGPSEIFYTYSDAAFPSCANEGLREENNSLALPDCRAYEQVSPTDGSEAYFPSSFSDASSFGFAATEFPMQSAVDGDAIAYIGEVPSHGAGEGTGNTTFGLGDQLLGTRGEHGWAVKDISPLGSEPGTVYEGFSADLSRGLIVSHGGRLGPVEEPPLSPDVETHCSVPYSRDTATPGAYTPLFTTEPGKCNPPFFAGASADGSQLVFESAAAKPEALPGNAKAAAGKGHENIYASVAGQLYLINVLPGAKPKPDPNATIGSLTETETETGIGRSVPALNTDHAVSTDGSRIFWTDLNTGIVYVRQNDAAPEAECGIPQPADKSCTLQVSSGNAVYRTATPDGRYAYYTEAGRLWRFDVETNTREDLTSSAPDAEVQGVIGVNETGEDGSYLYFVANGVLTGIERNADGETATAGQPNLYLFAGGVSFVAALGAADNDFNVGNGKRGSLGDWRADLGFRAAKLTPDGTRLVFMSHRRLSPYDNEGSVEIYVYDHASGEISCASCNPSGAPPPPADSQRYNYLPYQTAGNILRTPQFISDSGDRVFFNSFSSLVPADANGLIDVYEWERAGTGSCSTGSPLNGGGCLYLLSGGFADRISYLIDSSASGSDVFFVTTASLAPSDRLDKADVYDTRIDGGFPLPKEISCEERGACQGAVLPSPEIQSPGTSSFQTNEPPPILKCKKGQVKRRRHCVSKKHKSRHHRKQKRARRGLGGTR